MSNQDLDEILSGVFILGANYPKPTTMATVSKVEGIKFPAAKASILAWVDEVIGENEPEIWYNKDLVKQVNDYERQFLVEELPKRSRNELRAEQRNRAGLGGDDE